MKRKIAIIGTGYVGLTAGICLAYLGHEIICVDRDKEKIFALIKGKMPIYEPGLEKILRKYQESIRFTDDFKKAVKESEVIFICVGTPSDRNGNIDLAQYRKAINMVAKALQGYKVIVNKSTVPIGTGDWARKEINRHYKGDFSIVSNPEFLREGSAVHDFLEPDRVVIGVEDEKSREIMLDIYSPINAPKIIANIRSAEIIKYAANAFLATKISFINEIANICEKLGGNVKKVSEGIGLDKRIGKSFLNAGIGYGGSCFPKDVDGLIKMAYSRKYNFKILKAVIKVNICQQQKFVNKINRVIKKINGKTIGVLGLSFKPNTDDVRKSPAIEIIKILRRKTFKIQVYDPVAVKNAKRELSGITIKYCKNAIDVAKNADILALVTDWPEFSELDMRKIRDLMRHPYFFDGRNQFNAEDMKRIGFNYYGIGTI